MAVYEVFLKKPGEEYRLAGVLEAANDELAMILARETYVRRAEGDRFWLVNRDNVIVADTEFVSPNALRSHRLQSEAVSAEDPIQPITDPGVREFLLAFADDEHLMGQQHAEWIGLGPFLEEDLAMSSIGQDELGHAFRLYALIDGDDDRAVDALALGRSADEYRSCHLVEYATTDWAEQLVRHFLYDSAEQLRWELFERSSDQRLRDLANHASREESYHRRHAEGMVAVLLQSVDARRKLYAALHQLLPMALGLFEPVAGESTAIEAGLVAGPFAGQLPAWSERVARVFTRANWDVAPVSQSGRTERSTWFAPLMARMRDVTELDPTAVW